MSSGEPTGFLYPFIEAEEQDAGALVTDLVLSARGKMEESASLRADTLERCAEQVERAAAAMAERFARGGRLFSFGNGGSATDAQATAELFRHPPHGSPLPAISLVEDQAVLTALANDVGFELVFSRQLIAYADELDMAVGFSTSGDSADMLRAFEEAARRGLLTRRPVRLRGVGHGDERCRPALPGRALRERSPDSGGPGRPDPLPVGIHPAPPATAGSCRCIRGPVVTGRATDPVVGNGNATPRRARERPRSSNASRPSGAAGPGCATRS